MPSKIVLPPTVRVNLCRSHVLPEKKTGHTGFRTARKQFCQVIPFTQIWSRCKIQPWRTSGHWKQRRHSNATEWAFSKHSGTLLNLSKKLLNSTWNAYIGRTLAITWGYIRFIESYVAESAKALLVLRSSYSKLLSQDRLCPQTSSCFMEPLSGHSDHYDSKPMPVWIFRRSSEGLGAPATGAISPALSIPSTRIFPSCKFSCGCV